MTRPNTDSSRSKPHNVRSNRPILGSYKTMKLRDCRVAKGQPTSIPGQHVRAHALWLHDTVGLGDPAVAAAAGISHVTVHCIRTREAQFSQIAVGQRILSVGHIPVPAQAGCRVPSTGTKRRLRALAATGWSLRALADQLDAQPTQISDWMCRRNQVSYATWAAVTALYDTISATPGPSELARRRAATLKYPSAMAWEGVDIDHPDSEPIFDADPDGNAVDEVLLQRIIRGNHAGAVPAPERKALLDHAVAHHWTKTQVATALNLKMAAADQALHRHRNNLRKKEAAA
ncbi:hypothetical protein ACFO5K_04040 [Nocardia halotolerans]|uniref:Uncharacterized protein n=1 Tax=Nocardia halotolerans TaxID=1755878 RepID=A0ABV8VCN6_9NOCA